MNNPQSFRIPHSAFRILLGGSLLFLTSCDALDIGPDPSNAVIPQAVVPAEAHAPSPGAIPPAFTQPATQPSSTPLQLSVEEAVLTSLRYNPELQVERYNVDIERTFEQQQRAVFDPTISGTIQGGQSNAPTGTLNNRGGGDKVNSESASGNLQLSDYLPTGTSISAGLQTSYQTQSLYSDKNWNTRLGVSVTQSILRGGDLQANLALLREAGLQTRISQYQLRAYAESLVANVENAYWDYALALRQIDIYTNALAVAQAQLNQTNEFIHLGKLAPSERAAAVSEVGLRNQDLITARGNVETTRLRLLQLVSPGRDAHFWTRPVDLRDHPFVPTGVNDDVELHTALARRQRPEVNQARLQIQQGNLEIIRTKNGLLPKLDFFVTLGKTGYSNSFDESYSNMLDSGGYDVTAGITGSQALGNRDAEAQHERAKATRDQSVQSLINLINTVEVDVRTAYVNVNTNRQQIAATAATRAAEEESVRSETRKFDVGKSTSLLVAQAQRDLLRAQITEVQAVTTYLKSLVTLYQLEGSLLERRYINAPGRSTVLLPEEQSRADEIAREAQTQPATR